MNSTDETTQATEFEVKPGHIQKTDADAGEVKTDDAPAEDVKLPLSSIYDKIIKSVNGQELYSDFVKTFNDHTLKVAVGYANQSLNSNRAPMMIVADDTSCFVILMLQSIIIPSTGPFQDVVSGTALTELKRSYKISQEPSIISSFMRIKAAASLKFWEQKADPGFEGPED